MTTQKHPMVMTLPLPQTGGHAVLCGVWCQLLDAQGIVTFDSTLEQLDNERPDVIKELLALNAIKPTE